MTIETPRNDYDRGVRDGRVEIRLDHHDDRLDEHADLLARTVETAQIMASTVQTLTEARVTDAATRVATAEAVKEAKNAQEAAATTAWNPMAKLIAVVGALGVVFGIVVGLWALFGI